MELIRALISIYDNRKLQKKVQIFNDDSHGSLFKEFFDLVKSNPDIEEEILIKKLYGKNKLNIATYLKLKERLVNKLINIILLIDSKEYGFTELYQTYIQLNKDFLIGRILTSSGSSEIGNEIIDKTMKLALKYEFTDLQLLISRLQASHYGNIMQDTKKYEYYNSNLNSALERLMIESKLRQHIDEIHSYRYKELKSDTEHDLNFNEFIQYGLSVIKSTEYIQIRETAYNLILNCYFLTRNKQKYLSTGHDLITFFKSKGKIALPSLRKNIVDLIIGSYPLRLYEFSENLFQEYLTLFTSKMYNWYAIYYYMILMYLHQKEYEKAKTLVNECMSSPYFKSQSPVMQQHIYVAAAYTTYALNEGKKSKSDTPFRINKFINDVPVFNKEKRGMNISILVIQAAFLIQQGKAELLVDRIEALNQYAYRYLRKTELWRSSCFIKMLTTLVKYDFNKKWAAPRIKPLYDKMISVPIDAYPTSIEIEIIPFEDLWEMILNQIK